MADIVPPLPLIFLVVEPSESIKKNIQTPGDIEISLQSFHIPLKSIFTSMWNSEAAWWFQLLWKIWVRQLGLWHSQHMESHKINVPNHQPDGRVVTYLTIQNYHMEKKCSKPPTRKNNEIHRNPILNSMKAPPSLQRRFAWGQTRAPGRGKRQKPNGSPCGFVGMGHQGIIITYNQVYDKCNTIKYTIYIYSVCYVCFFGEMYYTI